MKKKNIPVEFVFQLFALIIAIIVVIGLAVTYYLITAPRSGPIVDVARHPRHALPRVGP